MTVAAILTKLHPSRHLLIYQGSTRLLTQHMVFIALSLYSFSGALFAGKGIQTSLFQNRFFTLNDIVS